MRDTTKRAQDGLSTTQHNVPKGANRCMAYQRRVSERSVTDADGRKVKACWQAVVLHWKGFRQHTRSVVLGGLVEASGHKTCTHSQQHKPRLPLCGSAACGVGIRQTPPSTTTAASAASTTNVTVHAVCLCVFPSLHTITRTTAAGSTTTSQPPQCQRQSNAAGHVQRDRSIAQSVSQPSDHSVRDSGT